MKKLILVTFLFSFSALATDSEALVKACRSAGVRKIVEQAQFLGHRVDNDKINECGVDNRSSSPVAYVWFCGLTTDGRTIQVMTQKPAFQRCF